MISSTLSVTWRPATGLTRMQPCNTRPSRTGTARVQVSPESNTRPVKRWDWKAVRVQRVIGAECRWALTARKALRMGLGYC